MDNLFDPFFAATAVLLDMKAALLLDRARLRSDRSDERIERITRYQPLWDYWSSGYAPIDAAREMELVR